MKNTFKVLGLTILAGSMMFAACNKDKEEENTPQATIGVTFNNQLVSINSYAAYTSESSDWFDIIADNETDNVITNLSTLSASTEELDSKSGWNVWSMTYTSTGDKAYTDEEGDTYAEWMNAEDETITVDAFDATQLLLSTTASATMGNTEAAMERYELITAPMSISAQNISMAIDPEQIKGPKGFNRVTK